MNISEFYLAHKTITISEKAYNSLKTLKQGHESFTNVILRITKTTKQKKDLLTWLHNRDPSSDLPDSVENVYKKRDETSLRY